MSEDNSASGKSNGEKNMRLGLISALVLALCGTVATAAEFPSSVVLKIGQSATSSWDTVGRVVAAHLGEFLPGKPHIDVETVDAGRGMQLGRQLALTEPHDGSVFAMTSMSMIVSSLTDPSTFDFSVKDYQWVGALADSVSFCVRKVGSDATIDKPGLILGAPAKNSSIYMNANAIKHMINTSAQVVVGFKSENELMAALDRGEIDMYCGVTRSTWLREGRQSTQELVAGIGNPDKLAELKVPALYAGISGLDMQAITFLTTSPTKFFSISLPAGTDPEVVAAYRKAFDEMNADPAFLTEIKAKVEEYKPSPGAEVQSFVANLLATDPAVIARAKELIN